MRPNPQFWMLCWSASRIDLRKVHGIDAIPYFEVTDAASPFVRAFCQANGVESLPPGVRVVVGASIAQPYVARVYIEGELSPGERVLIRGRAGRVLLDSEDPRLPIMRVADEIPTTKLGEVDAFLLTVG